MWLWKRKMPIGIKYRREYKMWKNMIYRCYQVDHQNYKDYGGRGIRVCSQWINDFASFFNDMGNAPENKSLGRIDNNGNYQPNNCEWQTNKEQANNKRKYKNSVFITYQNEVYTLSELARVLNVSISQLYYHYHKENFSIEKAIDQCRLSR